MARTITNGQLVKALTLPSFHGVDLRPIRVWSSIDRYGHVEVTTDTYRKLERNCYTPWGRGELGGAPVKART